MTPPAATYRLQLRGGLTLAGARDLVPYLDALGITHLYLSPVAAAAPGSAHGYDVIDPNRVDPALGGEPALADLAAAAHARGMGLILDIVPNHMAATADNAWWRDLLAGGPDAPHARIFDVDWHPPRQDLAGKVLLPVLGRHYGEALAAGELQVLADGPSLAYAEHRFPLTGADPAEVADARSSPAALHRLLLRQPYRLAYWRSGLREVNYRRFFDVSGLVGVRVEDPDVFATTHAGLLRWAAAGLLDGVRVDHVDGLWAPAGYLRRLAAALPPGMPVWVEKVLAPGEELPSAWACAGTTGYEFAAAVDALLYDGGGAAALDLLHARCGAPRRPYPEVLRAAKREVLEELFPAEVTALTRDLAALAARDRAGADLGVEELRRAVVELTAQLPVYRTYGGGDGWLAEAAAGAAQTLPAADAPALAFVTRVLAGESPDGADPAAWRAAAARWRQLSGPAMAKGGEDTALYRHVRLTALNEVGADPDTPGLTAEGFHAWCARRLARRAGGLSATSTHDSKRGEDVRARIRVLAEVPGLWSRHLTRWRAALGAAWAGVDARLALLLLQAALGAWPLDSSEVPEFADRLGAYARKAAREARRETSWLQPDGAHEARVARFVESLFATREFLDDFLPLQRLVAYYGAVNSLAQVVLKAACPGVPDVYQGCETWSLSLVDPDNRRPADFPRLRRALAELDAARPAAALFRAWPDGRIKLWVTAAALRFRRAHSHLFAEGEYLPVAADGRHARHLCCFARHAGSEWALAVVPRLVARLTGAEGTERAEPPTGAIWDDTRLRLPPGAPGVWRNVLTGATVESAAVADLLSDLPVALLSGATAR